jgi:hypothetical protein
VWPLHRTGTYVIAFGSKDVMTHSIFVRRNVRNQRMNRLSFGNSIFPAPNFQIIKQLFGPAIPQPIQPLLPSLRQLFAFARKAF